MKSLIKLAMIAFVAFTMSNCAQTTVGPSCTVSLIGYCYDYANATQATKDAGESTCKSLGIAASWATTGCTYSNCGTPDSLGVIKCTSN